MPRNQSGNRILGEEAEKGGGGNPFRDSAASMLDLLDFTLTLSTSREWSERHLHGGGYRIIE